VKNQSEYTVHLQKDGVTESFGPDEEIPAWAAKLITNPLVTGKGTEEDGKVVEGKDDDEKPAPRRGRPAKDTDES
jgi:hypothetical protein